jgi:predicted secreted protein
MDLVKSKIEEYDNDTRNEILSLVKLVYTLPEQKKLYAIEEIQSLISEYKNIKDKAEDIKFNILNNNYDHISEQQKKDVYDNKLYKKMVNDIFPYLITWWYANNNMMSYS